MRIVGEYRAGETFKTWIGIFKVEYVDATHMAIVNLKTGDSLIGPHAFIEKYVNGTFGYGDASGNHIFCDSE